MIPLNLFNAIGPVPYVGKFLIFSRNGWYKKTILLIP
jgi:hypothetical protein